MATPELDFIRITLQVAHTMPRLADTEASAPADPKGIALAINKARNALEMARRFLPRVNLSEMERASIRHELANLEGLLHLWDREEDARPENRK